MKHVRLLAAKVFPLALICAAPLPSTAMPVFDAMNLVQNPTAAKESVQQTIELVNQLQIRGLLIAQQNAIAARMQVEADREAQQVAAGALRQGTFVPSPKREW